MLRRLSLQAKAALVLGFFLLVLVVIAWTIFSLSSSHVPWRHAMTWTRIFSVVALRLPGSADILLDAAILAGWLIAAVFPISTMLGTPASKPWPATASRCGLRRFPHPRRSVGGTGAIDHGCLRRRVFRTRRAGRTRTAALVRQRRSHLPGLQRSRMAQPHQSGSPPGAARCVECHARYDRRRRIVVLFPHPQDSDLR